MIIMNIKRRLKLIERPDIKELYGLLARKKEPFWKKIREIVIKPKRKRIKVSTTKLNKFYKEGKIIVVPGKVLLGEIPKNGIKVAALSASKKALKYLKESGEFMHIKDIINYPVKDLMVII